MLPPIHELPRGQVCGLPTAGDATYAPRGAVSADQAAQAGADRAICAESHAAAQHGHIAACCLYSQEAGRWKMLCWCRCTAFCNGWFGF